MLRLATAFGDACFVLAQKERRIGEARRAAYEAMVERKARRLRVRAKRDVKRGGRSAAWVWILVRRRAR